MSPDRFEILRKYERVPAGTILRRYFTGPKFLDFAATSELHFASASQMTGDPEEGFFTIADQRTREEQLRGFSDRALNMARRAWDTVGSNNAQVVLLSCWSMGSAENNRIWCDYGRTSDAVAVETTVDQLSSFLGRGFLFVPVQYVDRTIDVLPDVHSLEPFFFKGRDDFAWENELRIVAEMERGDRLGAPRRVHIDAAQVSLTFIVHPDACASKEDDIRTLLAHRFGSAVIRRSTLETALR